jgi:hypothetical protein
MKQQKENMPKKQLELDAEKHAQAIVRLIADKVDNNGDLDAGTEAELVNSVASSLRGFAKVAHPHHFSTCEGCNKRASVGAGEGLPSGWSQCGLSRFNGSKFAEWCPECVVAARKKES